MGYGFSDVEKVLPASDETVYRIGYTTKVFTSLAVMQLHEKGEINYQNSVTEYIPELDMPNRFGDQNRLRIDHIMAHTAGLPSDVLNGFFCLNPPEQSWIISHLNLQHIIAPEGYAMAYSNAGYGLLGELIERRSGLSYDDYLTDNIFSPLGMNASYVNFDGGWFYTF